MKKLLSVYSLTILIGVTLLPVSAHAANLDLSPDRLDILDRRGYFTPAFKAAVHDLVDAKKAVVDAKAEDLKLNAQLPDLDAQVADANAKVEELRKQFSDLDRMSESDFVALQKLMADPSAKPEAQQILAQGYVWAYPTSPHQPEAQRILTDVQKKIADAAKAAADAEAARIAAHEKLVERAKAHDLTVGEWRDFLMSMSKTELEKFLGEPQRSSAYEWIYTEDLTVDQTTHEKMGLDVTFEGGRVINVSEIPHEVQAKPTSNTSD